MYNAMTTDTASIHLFLHPVDTFPGDFMNEFPLSGLTFRRKGFSASITFDYPYGEFDLDLFCKELEKIRPYTTYGKIVFSGVETSTMDEVLFRLIFDRKKKEWTYEKAELYFSSDLRPALNHSERMEFFGQLVDEVEDFLEQKGIDIPNEEKAEDEDAAIIYGTDYDQLAGGFEELLIGYGLLPQEGEEDA